MISITVRDGLGARVTTLANAMSSGRFVRFGWDINEHCPLPHADVFPTGIPGVEFTDPAFDAGFTEWNTRPFFSWDGAADRTLANAAYTTILAAMAGQPWSRFRLAICARFFRNPPASPQALAEQALRTALATGIHCLFLMADRHRAEIAHTLACGGVSVISAATPELTADLARTPAETRLFLGDWKTVLAAQTIVALDGPTCLLHPARAAGRSLIYAPSVPSAP